MREFFRARSLYPDARRELLEDAREAGYNPTSMMPEKLTFFGYRAAHDVSQKLLRLKMRGVPYSTEIYADPLERIIVDGFYEHPFAYALHPRCIEAVAQYEEDKTDAERAGHEQEKRLYEQCRDLWREFHGAWETKPASYWADRNDENFGRCIRCGEDVDNLCDLCGGIGLITPEQLRAFYEPREPKGVPMSRLMLEQKKQYLVQISSIERPREEHLYLYATFSVNG